MLRGGGRPCVDVVVAESVARTGESDDVGVVGHAVDHGGGFDLVAEYFAHRKKARFEVRMIGAVSYRRATSWKNRWATSPRKGR